MLKIGILAETKSIIDNRVAFTPELILHIQSKYPQVKFFVQKSNIRIYSDDDYDRCGISVVEDLNNCDILFGIKEVNIETLIPNKHYYFYGHLAKKQPYNRNLLKKMMQLGITFTDYEYLVDVNNKQLCSFGYWAGIVGTYNTIRAYGIRTKKFELEKPYVGFTLNKLLSNLLKIRDMCKTSFIITGNGQVSKGAQYIMHKLKAKELSPDDFLNRCSCDNIVYTVLKTENLVMRKDGKQYNSFDFKTNSNNYISCFDKYAYSSEILLSCHCWEPNEPIYLDERLLKDSNTSIKIVGDITCDINGSILCTIRSSTHDEPFYDFNPITMSEEPPFSSDNNISVMAVDTCPNALALESSEYFGKQLTENVLPLILNENIDRSPLKKATILLNGKLTDDFLYLKNYANI